MAILLYGLLLAGASAHGQQAGPGAGARSSSSFLLASHAGAVPILVDTADYWLVQQAAAWLSGDIQQVTGSHANVLHDLPGSLPGAANRASQNVRTLVIVGSLGKSKWISRLIAAKKIQATSLDGKWETYSYQVVPHPFKGVSRALVIVGSDRRGTAYGVLDISRQMGVSPWYWWADVPIRHRDSVWVNRIPYFSEPPGVKYRGIFINDEAPAFSGWAREKFGGANHLVYTKVFELLLRLKANYLWPAMWGNAFNDDDKMDPALADQYGIVMGTSHHEPMLRAQQEWKRYGSGAWNYETNAPILQEFWRKGIENMGTHESIVTIGMRGDGDKPMTEGSNVALLEKIVADQRHIITGVTGRKASDVPQSWALYKEVQDYYDKGMRVPDDVTLLLCDDNWGNIRKLPKPGSPPRTGGYGIYYHFDYVGDPRNYKWLNTNAIPRVWEQMHLAYDNDVRQIWIVNVGDLKPMELPISFLMDYAWDPKDWGVARVEAYAQDWASEQFGPTHAVAIGHLVSEYTYYNSRRKPELLSPDTYSLTNYREAERVTAAYDLLARQANTLYQEMPLSQKDAFYELVLFPIQVCANLGDLYLAAATNHLYARQGRAATNAMGDSVRAYYLKDSLLTRQYNKVLAGGKWDHMMDQTHIGYTHWQEPPFNKMPSIDTLAVPEAGALGVAVEGSEEAWGAGGEGAALPTFNVYLPQRHYIDVFNRGTQPFDYTVTADVPWIRITPGKGTIDQQQRVWVSVVDHQGLDSGTIRITGSAGQSVSLPVRLQGRLAEAVPSAGFVENDRYVAMQADHYTTAHASTLQWVRIPQVGRSGTGMTVFPVTAEPGKAGAGPSLDYNFFLFDTGTAKIQAYCAPTLDYYRSGGRRFALSVDEEAPVEVHLPEEQGGPVWSAMVADNIAVVSIAHFFARPGAHVLHFWMVDPGVVLENLVIDLGGVRPSYLGPPQTPMQAGLKDYFRDYFPVGVAVSPRSVSGPDTPLVLQQFNSLTPENAMKMGPIHPEEDRYNFRDADSIVEFAQTHGLRVRGHNLCWHQQTPAWLFKDAAGAGTVTKEVLLQRLKDHIQTVAGRYKGKIYTWDVVNEAISDDSTQFLRNSPWFRICGEDFIRKAFEYAHAADPSAKLFYNDYNSERPEKRERIFRLLKDLVDEGVPIDGVGMQGHWSIYEPSGKDLRHAIERFSSLGLAIQITEMDVSVYPWEKNMRVKLPSDTDAYTADEQQRQTAQYAALFDIFREYQAVITGITFWNVTDRHTWLDAYPVPGRKNYPLLFDVDGSPKEAYWDILP